MFPKEFIIEDGHLYYRKKPLYKQPLFWTTVVSVAVSFVLFILCVILAIAVGEGVSSDYEDTSAILSDYKEHELGQTVTTDDDLEVTVESVKEDGKLNLVIDSESQAVVVKARIKNSGEEAYYLTEYSFSLYDSTESEYYLDLRTYDVNIPEKIAPGESVDLTLVYAGIGDSNYTVTFGDDSWRSYESNSI